MFFLLGLLYEHRADNKRARRLYQLDVKEDPTFCWPAILAQQKI